MKTRSASLPQRSACVLVCVTLLMCVSGVRGGDLAGEAERVAAFTSGADLRLRDEYFNGASTLSTEAALHEQNYLRFRARAWTSWAANELISVRGRITVEPRYWTTTSSAKAFAGRDGLEERFGMIDELAVDWKVSPGSGGNAVAVTAGRQELKFGEAGNGWLIAEGTPGDGSWMAYFDAVRATVKNAALHTTIDVVVIDQDSDLNNRLPTLGRSENYPVTEEDERGVIVYVANKSVRAAQIDAFVIYKENHRVLANGNAAELFTPGFRVAGDLSTHWQYQVEGAYQFGRKKDPTVKNPVPATMRRDVRAAGANSRITWLARDAMEQRVSLIAEYISGDDPGTTETDEMFDLLWGRCPRFSDIVATAFSVENVCTYQAANLVRVGPEWSFAPTKATGLTVGWQRLFAPETVPTRTAKLAAFSGGGHERGDFFRATWRQKFSKSLSGLVTVEALKQGDFYARRDTLKFLRLELALAF
jgi:hypothetical protein